MAAYLLFQIGAPLTQLQTHTFLKPASETVFSYSSEGPDVPGQYSTQVASDQSAIVVCSIPLEGRGKTF